MKNWKSERRISYQWYDKVLFFFVKIEPYSGEFFSEFEYERFNFRLVRYDGSPRSVWSDRKTTWLCPNCYWKKNTSTPCFDERNRSRQSMPRISFHVQLNEYRSRSSSLPLIWFLKASNESRNGTSKELFNKAYFLNVLGLLPDIVEILYHKCTIYRSMCHFLSEYDYYDYIVGYKRNV